MPAAVNSHRLTILALQPRTKFGRLPTQPTLRADSRAGLFIQKEVVSLSLASWFADRATGTLLVTRRRIEARLGGPTLAPVAMRTSRRPACLPHVRRGRCTSSRASKSGRECL